MLAIGKQNWTVSPHLDHTIYGVCGDKGGDDKLVLVIAGDILQWDYHLNCGCGAHYGISMHQLERELELKDVGLANHKSRLRQFHSLYDCHIPIIPSCVAILIWRANVESLSIRGSDWMGLLGIFHQDNV